MKAVPLHDNVVIRRKKAEETTKGGLIIPATAVTKSHEGEVLAVGKGKVMRNGVVVAPDVKVGDVVMFDHYVEVKLDGEMLLLVKEEHIIAVLG